MYAQPPTRSSGRDLLIATAASAAIHLLALAMWRAPAIVPRPATAAAAPVAVFRIAPADSEPGAAALPPVPESVKQELADAAQQAQPSDTQAPDDERESAVAAVAAAPQVLEQAPAAARPPAAAPARTEAPPTKAAAPATAPGAEELARAAEESARAKRNRAAVRARYEDVLFAWLDRNKEYPLAARRRRLEGDGTLRIVVNREGRVLRCELSRGTEHAILNEAAIRMVARADPFPPMPKDYPGDRFEFIAPVSFRLH